VTATVPPSPTLEPTPIPSPTTNFEVTITADGGNLNIRRGPSLAYNVVGFLTKGETTYAIGRTEESDWLYVEIPGRTGIYAWVSADSPYSAVQGPIAELLITLNEPAVPAFLRNCTFHPMKIVPGDFTLKPQTGAPDNRRQVNPGHYEAFDQSVAGEPKVFAVDIHEGNSIDIKTDGLGGTYACP
jgi:hypothetical protein